jgi:hypothetical protein
MLFRSGNGRIYRSLSLDQGRAVQVDPIKPTLKASGTKRLKLQYDEPLSKVAFKFNLRRYTKGGAGIRRRRHSWRTQTQRWA